MRLLLVGCSVLGALLCLGPPAQAAPPVSLESELGSLREDRLMQRSAVGIQVVDLASGVEVFAHNADTAMSPASTMKILTAAAALDALGPAYRWKTALMVDAPPDADGRLSGPLYVVGTGDPTLVIERLWKMVVDLKVEGVTQIDGDLVFDDGFFDEDTALAGWNKAADIERGPSYFPSLSALSVNFNTVALTVRPSAKSGQAAVVALETPASGYVEVVSSVTTGSSRSRRSITVKREVLDSGKMRFTLSGTTPQAGSTARYYRTVQDPTAHFMAVFRGLLEREGIAVSGSARRGAVPEDATPLVTLHSRSLASVAADMNKQSNNFMAELMLRTLGREASGQPGSTANGLDAVTAYLERMGAAGESLNLVNGSGLSREARIPPSVLTSVLLDMARNTKVGPEFQASLAIAGWDGTLSKRLVDDAGLLRGKTGTIGGVHCLAGYVTSDAGRRYAFAFMVNEVSGGTAQVKALHDRFAGRMFRLGEDSAAGETKSGPETVSSE